MHVGFTGTRKGMSEDQATRFVLKMLAVEGELVFHHGDCIGADAEAHHLVREFRPDAIIHIHPPEDPKQQAFCDGDREEEPKEYIERNRDIVRASDLLIAAPAQDYNMPRGSGTWATIRYSRKAGVRLAVIDPNGNVLEDF